MVGLLEQGLSHLAEQLLAHNSLVVTYRRGADSANPRAIIGRTMYRTSSDGQSAVDFSDRDYLIAPAELVLGGSPVEPQDGDRIEETRDGQTYTYEVLPIAGEPSWRWSDPFRKLYRIHTKLVSVA